MSYPKIVVVLFSIIFSLMVSDSVAYAQISSDFTVREQCFTTLKENLKEASIFYEPLKNLNGKTYKEIEQEFSKNYKNLSSFGIDIDGGDFEMRLYSFGKQTGYVHPPNLPIPSSSKSDIWENPAKEYIVAEEYINDNDGNKHFLDCSFFQLSAQDLMVVTRDRYSYDGVMVSMTKNVPDGNYKAW